MCSNMEGIIDLVLSGKEIILCRESAAGFLGISNGWGIPCVFYTSDNDIINSKYTQGIKVGELDYSNTLEIEGITVTNEERTICELIRYECDVQEILESMSNHYFKNGEKFSDKLINMVREYEIEEEFEGFKQDAIEYYDD